MSPLALVKPSSTPSLPLQDESTATRLDDLEDVIQRGIGTFIEVGTALREIQETRLYRLRGYPSFEAYLKEKWGFQRHYGYRLIRSATIAGLLPTGIIQNEGQARELSRLDDDEEILATVKDLRKRWGPDQVTAKRIRALVDKRLDRIRREKEQKYFPADSIGREHLSSTWDIRIGDFNKVLNDLKDVDAVVCDPPYGKEFLCRWDDLGSTAARILKPGGHLACYSGHMYLPEILAALSRHLTYRWTLALVHRYAQNSAACVMAPRVICRWKPLLLFRKSGGGQPEFLPDVIEGGGVEKDSHAWQQAEAESKWLIENLSAPGELIVDPCTGSGTVGAAAIASGRKFIGSEIDGGTARKARARLAGVERES